jgi:hypothetical protein
MSIEEMAESVPAEAQNQEKLPLWKWATERLKLKYLRIAGKNWI